MLEAMVGVGGVAVEYVKQLIGALRALQGIHVPALSEADLAGGWRDREDIGLIIDRVTRAATETVSLWLAPWQPRPSGGWRVPLPRFPPSLPSMAVRYPIRSHRPTTMGAVASSRRRLVREPGPRHCR